MNDFSINWITTPVEDILGVGSLGISCGVYCKEHTPDSCGFYCEKHAS
jgi:hypothetical protein